MSAKSFIKAVAGIIFTFCTLSFTPGVSAEENPSEPSKVDDAAPQPPTTPQKGGGAPELVFYVSSDCTGWYLTEASDPAAWTGIAYFVIGAKGGEGTPGSTYFIPDRAYRDSGARSRTFVVTLIGHGGEVLNSYNLTDFRDISECLRAPAPTFTASIDCSPLGESSVYTLALKGELDRFIRFENEQGWTITNGSPLVNIGQMIYGYYQTGSGPYDVAKTSYPVQSVIPCGIQPATPFYGPISPSTAELIVTVTCSGSYNASLLIDRKDDEGVFGLYYPGTAMRLVDGVVALFNGPEWPAPVTLTDSQGRDVKISTTVSYTSCTVTEVAVEDATGSLLPATGSSSTGEQSFWAAVVVAAGVVCVFGGRRRRTA